MPGDVNQQAMKILLRTQMQRLGKVSVLHWKREKARRAGVKGARETLAGNKVAAVARARTCGFKCPLIIKAALFCLIVC